MDRKTFLKLLGGSGLGLSLMGLGMYPSTTKTESPPTISPLFFRLALVQKTQGLLKFLNFAKELKPYGLQGLIYRTSLLSTKTDWEILKRNASTAGLRNLGLRIEETKIELKDYQRWAEVAAFLGCQFIQLNLNQTDYRPYLERRTNLDLVVESPHSRPLNLIRQINSSRCSLATSLSELNRSPQHINFAKIIYLTSDCQNLGREDFCKSLQILKSSGYRDFIAIDSYSQSNLRQVSEMFDLVGRYGATLI